jgi:hypothetical protein
MHAIVHSCARAQRKTVYQNEPAPLLLAYAPLALPNDPPPPNALLGANAALLKLPPRFGALIVAFNMLHNTNDQSDRSKQTLCY